MYKELTTRQYEALRAFAEIYGRKWKGELQDQWMKAKCGPVLQELRNTHGPSWLAKFKI